MAPVAVLASLLTLVGIGIALRATNGRMTTVGLGLALLPLPLAAGDAPALLVLAFRTLAVLVALFLLDMGVRSRAPLVGPIRLGGDSETAVVVAAFLIGLLLAVSSPEPRGPALALATAIGLGVAGLTLLAFGSDTLRLGVGATFVLAAGSTLVPALGGADDAALELTLAAGLVAVTGVTAWLAMVGVEVRRDLELADLPRDVTHRAPGPPLISPRQRRLIVAGLGGALLVGAALLVVPGIVGWLGQFGGGGTGVVQPTPTPASTPGSTAIATPEPTVGPTATPEATVGPSATPEATPAATPQIYVVVKGDRLGIIARRFGVTLAALEKANDITDPTSLQIGQKLIIPPP
jgi:hypothetical protein